LGEEKLKLSPFSFIHFCKVWSAKNINKIATVAVLTLAPWWVQH
jgi:hypothetical protein